MPPDPTQLIEYLQLSTPLIGFYDAPDPAPFEPLCTSQEQPGQVGFRAAHRAHRPQYAQERSPARSFTAKGKRRTTRSGMHNFHDAGRRVIFCLHEPEPPHDPSWNDFLPGKS